VSLRLWLSALVLALLVLAVWVDIARYLIASAQ